MTVQLCCPLHRFLRIAANAQDTSLSQNVSANAQDTSLSQNVSANAQDTRFSHNVSANAHDTSPSRTFLLMPRTLSFPECFC